MHPFSSKFRILKLLVKIALLGIPLGLVAWYLTHESTGSRVCAIAAGLLVVPCFVFTYVFTILYWKSRNKGDHSDLSGVLLLIETRDWMKIVYLIRHLLPDMMGKGRYEPR